MKEKRKIQKGTACLSTCRFPFGAEGETRKRQAFFFCFAKILFFVRFTRCARKTWT